MSINIDELIKKGEKASKKRPPRKRMTSTENVALEYSQSSTVPSPSSKRPLSVLKSNEEKKPTVPSPSSKRPLSVLKSNEGKKPTVPSPSLATVPSPSLDLAALNSLSLNESNLIFYVLSSCKEVGGVQSQPIYNSDLSKALEIKPKTLRNYVHKLSKLGWFSSTGQKGGKKPYRIYEFKQEVYDLLSASRNFRIYNIQKSATVLSPSFDTVPQPSQSVPNNNNFNNNLLDNYEKRIWSMVEYPDFFREHRFKKDNSVFSIKKFEELKSKWIEKSKVDPENYTPENLNDSLKYVAFDIQYKNDFWIDRLGGLFSALKTPYEKPEDFKTEAELQKFILDYQDEMTHEENLERVWSNLSSCEQETFISDADLVMMSMCKTGMHPERSEVIKQAKNLALKKHLGK